MSALDPNASSPLDLLARLRELEQDVARLRASLLGMREERPLVGPAFSMLRARLERQLYGIELGSVVEIVRVVRLVQVRNAPDAVLGVMNYRGQPVTTVDLGIRFGTARVRWSRNTPIVIARARTRLVGLVVESVEDIAEVEAHGVRPSPLGAESDACIVGVVERDGSLTQLVDAELLLAALEAEAAGLVQPEPEPSTEAEGEARDE